RKEEEMREKEREQREEAERIRKEKEADADRAQKKLEEERRQEEERKKAAELKASAAKQPSRLKDMGSSDEWGGQDDMFGLLPDEGDAPPPVKKPAPAQAAPAPSPAIEEDSPAIKGAYQPTFGGPRTGRRSLPTPKLPEKQAAPVPNPLTKSAPAPITAPKPAIGAKPGSGGSASNPSWLLQQSGEIEAEYSTDFEDMASQELGSESGAGAQAKPPSPKDAPGVGSGRIERSVSPSVGRTPEGAKAVQKPSAVGTGTTSRASSRPPSPHASGTPSSPKNASGTKRRDSDPSSGGLVRSKSGPSGASTPTNSRPPSPGSRGVTPRTMADRGPGFDPLAERSVTDVEERYKRDMEANEQRHNTQRKALEDEVRSLAKMVAESRVSRPPSPAGSASGSRVRPRNLRRAHLLWGLDGTERISLGSDGPRQHLNLFDFGVVFGAVAEE
ncbi:hypothetical protein CYMTET_35303, partial [Cymbomonas tetramitiformis]